MGIKRRKYSCFRPALLRWKAVKERSFKAAGSGGTEADDAGDPCPKALPPLDFSTFVLSLGSSVQVHLGAVEGLDGQHHRDLASAKQVIDILGILEEKTRGNLSDGEEKLLRSLLYDLRVQFVDAQKA